MRFTSSESSLVLHRYVLRVSQGNWAVVTIGSDGMFTAISSWGNYAYWWSHHGRNDAREFIAGVTDDPDYFVGKLGGPDEYDGEATLRLIRRHIVEHRRSGGYTAVRARKEWDLLDRFDLADNEADFARWYDATGIDCASEFMCKKPCSQAVAFVEQIMVAKLAPLLLEELVAEKQGQAEARSP